MFLVKFCCAQVRENDDQDKYDGLSHQAIDPDSSATIERNIKKQRNVLKEFARFEKTMNLHEENDFDVMNMITEKSN